MTELWDQLDCDPSNPITALTNALVLGIVAPSEEQTQRAVALVEHFAVGLTPEQVEAAKAAAMERIDASFTH